MLYALCSMLYAMRSVLFAVRSVLFAVRSVLTLASCYTHYSEQARHGSCLADARLSCGFIEPEGERPVELA